VLQIDADFLELPVNEWEDSQSYLTALEMIQNLWVVNDSAERGVKLASDFLSAAHIEKRYQNVLQVVENDRAQMPNQRKRMKHDTERWFINLHVHCTVQ
jgi:hypothetical protein